MAAIRHILAVWACLSIFTTIHAAQLRRVPGAPATDYAGTIDRDNPAVWESSDKLYMTKAAASGTYANRNVIRTGSQEYLLVLVDFNDRHFYYQDTARLKNHFKRIFNEPGYSDIPVTTYKGTPIFPAIGSVSDYFHAQSYGKYTPKFKVIGPIHASKGYAYYGKGTDTAVRKLVREICDSITADGEINLMDYTRNGIIESLFFIYAGRGENYFGSEINCIYPHADTIRNYMSINRINYACSCELFWDSDTIMDGIGTICHEFAHTLGLPDFYNRNSDANSQTTAAMGYWSLMDYGNYQNSGFAPSGFTAFEKYSLGWMDLEEINDPGHYTLDDITKIPDHDAGIHSAYRINTTQENSFIILENRSKTGWYSYDSTEGLMVTAVRYDKNSWSGNTVNTSTNILNKRYHIIAADNNYNRNSNAGDLFPYQGLDSITTKGQPMLTVASYIPQHSIYNIRKDNTIISFYAGPDKDSHVETHHATEFSISVIDGELSVTAPVGSTVTVHDISGKTIFQNIMTQPTQHIALPGRGIWIIKCGGLTRKVTQ